MPNFKTYCNITTPVKDLIVIMSDKTGSPTIASCVAYNRIVSQRINPNLLIGIGDFEDDQATTHHNSETLAELGSIPKYSTPGNHDFDFGDRVEFDAAFNGGGYQKVSGNNVDFFIYDLYLNVAEDGYFTYENASARSEASFKTSAQGQWIIAQLAASTAAWKVVVFHQPVTDWVSWDGSINPAGLTVPGMAWDWKGYGADILLTGHEHFNERLTIDTGSGNMPVLVCGPTGTVQIAPDAQIATSDYLVSLDVEFTIGTLNILEATATDLTIKTLGVNATRIISTIKDTLTLSK